MNSRLLAKASAFALAAAVGAPQFALAQSASDDQIIVTGSFIKRKAQGDLPSPLETVDAAAINAIGAQNIADITQTLTINTGAQNNPDAFTQNATTGTSNINLRGLGVGSTLVILNGKRQVLTAATTNDGISFVDTASLVPLIAIDRVEILKDGASALYGSDAVAGVVNFITREDYDGILLSGDYLTHQSEGSYNEFNIQGLVGKTFDRGSVMAAVSYLERTGLTTEERRLSRPQDDTSALGNPGAFFGVPGVPAGAPFIDPGCAANGGFPLPASAAAAPLLPLGIGFCGFDFGDFFNLVPEEKRLNIFAQGKLNLTDNITWKVEGGYADNEASRGNSPTFPFLQLGSAVVPGAALAGFGVTPNPFNIFPGDPTVVFFGRASGNGGQVSPNLTTSETWRISTSLGGDFEFLRNGAWEISFTRARNNFVVQTEDTVTDRFQCALSGFSSIPTIPGLTPGTNCTAANPDLTANGSALPAAGTFFNPFSTSFNVAPNSAALLDYLVQFQTRDLQSDLTVVEGFVSTELFDLPAGPVGIAVGGQYRDNDLAADFDEISLRDGFAFLVGEQPFGGSQDVYAFFGEVQIPVTSWADIQAAVRYENYGEDGGGSTVDPKVALLVRPTDGLSFRGSYSTSFRAPSVFQQVGQGTTLQQVTDPLAGTAFVAVRQSGDQNLLPETSRAFNVGASWEPISGLTFDIDYFDFSFENVIIAENPQAIINATPLDADPANPTRIIRAPGIGGPGTGALLQINTNFVNASSVDTSGLDFAARWTIDSDIGTFQPTFIGTYVLSYDLIDPQAGPVDGAGNRNFRNFGSPTPELRFNAGLAWRNGPHSANIFGRYIDSYTDDQNAGREVDSDVRIDVQYSLAINEFMNRDKLASITIGARNITGTRAPQVFTNGGFDSRVHDPRGSLLYFGVNLEF